MTSRANFVRSEEGVAEGWAAEAEVRVARAEADVVHIEQKVTGAEARMCEAEAEALEWRASAASARAEAERSELRMMAAESRAANAEAKLTSSEVAAAVADAQVKLQKVQIYELQRHMSILEAANLEWEKKANEALKRADYAETMLKTADDRLEAAVHSANVGKARAEERARLAEARLVTDITRAQAAAAEAERRAEICRDSASIAISQLRQRDGTVEPRRAGSPLRSSGKSTPATTATDTPTTSLLSSSCHSSVEQLDPLPLKTSLAYSLGPKAQATPRGNVSPSRRLSLGSAAPSPSSTPGVARGRSQSPLKGQGSPTKVAFGSRSPMKGASGGGVSAFGMAPPSSPSKMNQIRAQVSQQLKNLQQF